MPYRAMIWTMLTIALALLAIGLWLRAVGPMLHAQSDSAEAASHSAMTAAALSPATRHDPAPPPEKALAYLIQGVLLLSFLLVCLLLVVGFAATVREWMRDASVQRGPWWRRSKRTPYVDAWSIAGKRLKVDGESAGPGSSQKPPED